MPGWKPFSLRKKLRERGPVRIFEYEQFSKEFLTKLAYTLIDWIATLRPVDATDFMMKVQRELAKALGIAEYERVGFGVLLEEVPYDHVLDIIELVFHNVPSGYQLADPRGLEAGDKRNSSASSVWDIRCMRVQSFASTRLP